MSFFESIIDYFNGHSDFSSSGHVLDMGTLSSCIDNSHCEPESIRLFAREVIDSVLGDGDISFEGNYDMECRDKAASQLVEDLKRYDIFVRSSDIYHEKDMGGLTRYSANVIKEAVNNARLHGRIDHRTFENLMDQVKKACYCV